MNNLPVVYLNANLVPLPDKYISNVFSALGKKSLTNSDFWA
jgi:hypothetical protein